MSKIYIGQTDLTIKLETGKNLASITSASIIAKVTRDRIMRQWDEIYPQYGFAKHKGYGTAAHIQAIKEYGLCPLHRLSFVKNIINKD